MKLLNSGYSINTENYHKLTPWALKFIADIGLLVAGITEVLPTFSGKEWIVAIGIGFKLLTKFISEHPRP